MRYDIFSDDFFSMTCTKGPKCVIRKRSIFTITAERAAAIIGLFARTISDLSQTPDDQKAAVMIRFLAQIPDLLSIPVYQQMLVAGLALGLSDRTKISGEGLFVMRRAAGVTQETVARALGVTQANVASWEAGKWGIPERHIPAIRRALGYDAGAGTMADVA